MTLNASGSWYGQGFGQLSALNQRSDSKVLAIIDTHPIQYHAPVYRYLERVLRIPIHVIYGSDFSITGYHDKEFGISFKWDTKLVGESDKVSFITRSSEGGPTSIEALSGQGLGRILDRVCPAAVLLTGYQPKFHYQAFVQVWRRRYPILFRGETTDHGRMRGVLKGSARDLALRCLYARCARLLPIGARSYEHYRRLRTPEEKLVFSPYCVDISAFQCDESVREYLRARVRSEQCLEQNRLVILFSGKLSSRKGVSILLEAAKRLPDEYRIRVVLLFLGDGPERHNLETAAHAEPEVEARFIGFKNQSELSPYYHAADLLVLPSVHSETWGLVVNEALHHGIPCVVSDAVGCAPDLVQVGATGEIAVTGSVESLTDALVRAFPLCADPRTRTRCREKVDPYTVPKAAEGIAQAFWSLVQRRRQT